MRYLQREDFGVFWKISRDEHISCLMGMEAPTADAHWRTLSQACRLCLLCGRVEAGRDRDVRIRRRTTRLEENLSILFLQLLCWGLNLYGSRLAAEKKYRLACS